MKLIPDALVYQAAFALERANEYPAVDAFEAACGCAIDRAKLEAAARVLACPVKAHPPNWQHGRVIYAAVRAYLATSERPIRCLDIGTAKGFSALCLNWAVHDGCGQTDSVVSVDVIDPESATRRNTVAECNGLLTLAETLAPWPESGAISFLHDTGIDWLARGDARLAVAYVDGKHDYDVVRAEGRAIAARQKTGDLAIFDDLQIQGVADAVSALAPEYTFQRLEVTPWRRYAIGTRR